MHMIFKSNVCYNRLLVMMVFAKNQICINQVSLFFFNSVFSDFACNGNHLKFRRLFLTFELSSLQASVTMCCCWWLTTSPMRAISNSSSNNNIISASMLHELLPIDNQSTFPLAQSRSINNTTMLGGCRSLEI